MVKYDEVKYTNLIIMTIFFFVIDTHIPRNHKILENVDHKILENVNRTILENGIFSYQ